MPMKLLQRLFFSLLLCLTLPSLAAERQIQCKVVGIADGDTLTCLHNRNQLKVRLQHIDAPESGQAFGQKAKQALTKMVFKKQVRLQISGYDRYQRVLAVVWDGQKNVNLALVEQGMAWAYRQTQPIYQQAQTAAQQKRLGLWADSNPIEPSEWRASKWSHSSQNLQKNRQTTPLAQGQVDCSKKKSCRQFNDYATALRHFQQCGWQELDGNNDGIPCNKLYRKAQKR